MQRKLRGFATKRAALETARNKHGMTRIVKIAKKRR